MKKSTFSYKAILVAVCFFTLTLNSCNKSDNPATDPTSGFSRQTYNGTATTVVELFTIYGQSKGVFQFQTNVTVTIDQPRKDPNGLTESNPFNFYVQSKPVVNAPGEIQLNSATVALNAMFQYWSFNLAGGNSQWQGTLTDNHTAEAIAQNLMTLPIDIAPNVTMPTTVAMANGTRMSGEFNGNSLTIVVEGNSTGGTTPFQMQIVASR